MSRLDRIAKLREQIARLKQQVPSAAQLIRNAKAALPAVVDPVKKAKQALEGAAPSVAQLTSLHLDIEDITKSFPEINKTVTDASSLLAMGQQGLQDALKQTAADAQQAALAKVQSALPMAALNDAKKKAEEIKAKLEKSKDAISKLNMPSIAAIATQIPQLSDLVGKTLGSVQGIDSPISKALGALGGAAGVPLKPEDIAAKLAKVQEHAASIGQHVSSVSGLMSKGAAAVPAVQQRVDQIQKMLTGAAPGGTFESLAGLVDQAMGESGVSEEIEKASAKFNEFSALGDQGMALLNELSAGNLPADLKDKVAQIKGTLDQSLKQLPGASSLVANIAKQTGDISGQVKKAKDVLGNITKTLGGPPAEKVAALQGHVETLQKQFGGLTKTLSGASAALPDLEKKFSQAKQLLAGGSLQQFQDLIGGLSSNEGVSGLTALAGGNLTGALQGHLDNAQKSLNDLLGGQIPESAKGMVSQLQGLIGDATKSFPDLSKSIATAGGGVGDIAKHLESAKKLASSFSPDILKQAGAATAVTDLLGKAAGQFPAASQAVSQLTQSFPQVQASIGKAQQLFGDLASGKVSGGAALQQLAGSSAVQQFLKQAGELSGASKLIADHAKNLSGLQGQVTQAAGLMKSLQSGDFSSAEAGQALADMQSSLANAAKSELSKHLSSALGSSGALGTHLSTIQAAMGQIQSGQLPAAAQGLLKDLTGSLGDVGGQLTSISSTISQASSSFGSLASQLQNANGGAAGLTAAFAQQLGQTANMQKLMDQAAQQFPAAAALVSQASSALPQLQEKFAQGQQLLNGVMSGTVKPEDLLKQLSASPEMQGVLSAAQAQFPAAANLISQANQMLPQLKAGLDTAKNVAASLQSGDLTAAMGALQSSPQVQALLGDAAKQFPAAAAALQQAQATAAQVQAGLNTAKGALDDLQKGNYQGALTAVAGIPAVAGLLGEAQKQFPQAAALVGQAQAALPAIKEGLAQANQAMAAMQSGNYAGALAQLQSMPAVQGLLGEAAKQFPQAAALAGQAQAGIAAAQAGLDQAKGLITAFQAGDTNAALAQLQQIPAVQNLLGAAQAQFPQAAAALTQAAAVLPQVQAHLDQASAMINAAAAGDLTQLAAVQTATAEATTAVAAAETAESAAAEDTSTASSSSSESASSSSSSTAAASESSSSSSSAAVVEDAPAAAAEADATAEGEVLLTISTPLENEFVMVNIRGDEMISGLFTYRAEVTTQDEDIDFSTIVGENVTVYVDLGEDTPRYINGIVTRITQGSTDDDDNTTYVLEVRPWLWKLTKAADCRIYQAMSSVDIITGIFDELGFTDYENKTTGTYTARDYCVQYRETAFNFVSRLMEEEGIFYFFKHEDGKHTLVLADDSDNYPNCHVPEIEFDPTDSAFEDEIFKASIELSLNTAKYLMDDFHFETSTTDLLATAAGEGMSWYEYPGGFTTTDAGNAIATKRLAAIEASNKVMRGNSTVKTLVAGCKFTLSQHVRESANAAYVVRRVTMRCDQQKYGDSFEAIPADVVFRAPVVTPKPIIHGSQTALVVGKSGEEIWVDKYGRVKVQFHWDQKGKKDETSSCWVRVSQGWAGKTWGMIFLPRIGDEVVVSFLEGNPDRPLITGSVYNAQSTVPYTLPDDQTKSTIKTRSSKQGTAGNEIRFQDLKDSEEFYLHAQKDMKHLVENDWVKHVKNSEQTFVQKDDPTAETDFKHVLVVDGKRKVLIKGDANEETHTNEGKFTQAVTKEFTLTVDGDTLTITAKGDLKITGKTVSIESSSGDITIKSAANLKSEASQALNNKSGTELKNEAGTALTNKSGTDLKNEAGTALSNKAGLELKNEGLTITNKASASQECDGGGMLTLKGGMVKLN
jgi:type VI secretion system secreted protein VgrG